VRSIAVLSLIATLTAAAACSDQPAKPPSSPTPTCSFSVSLNTTQFGPDGGKATASVTTTSSCAWSATSDTDWIALEGGSNRTGDGTVPMTVKSFDGTSERVATLTVAQQTFKLTQNGCLIHLSDSELSFAGDGGYVDLRVETANACRWTVDGDLSWAGLEPASGTGSGVTRVRANRNQSTAARTAALRLGGQPLALRQSGGTETPTPPPPVAACTYSVNPVEAYVHSSGGLGVVNVSTPSGCTWTAASSLPHAHILRGASGSGPGAIEYSVDANPDAYVVDFRKVAIEVRWPSATAGQNVWLSQFGNCGGAGNREIYTIPAAGGNVDAHILVESAFQCPWRMQGGAPWLTIIGPPLDRIIRGDANLHVIVQPNTTGQARTTELIVAERIFVIKQLAQ
jgi:BACON domain-containing protein